MRFGEQERVLRMIPGLEHAEFLRFGQVHRNTYINGPALLGPTLQLRAQPKVFFAGQISGVEGYVESIATGFLAGAGAAALVEGRPVVAAPRATALGSLTAYVSGADAARYQPANITFDLLPKLEVPPRDKKARYAEVCRRALAALEEFREPVARPGRVTIFVELLDEGTRCWRPVSAERLSGDRYRILDAPPEDESWSFQAGEIVRCELRKFSDGSGLTAYEAA
jgi:hypothetical protein